jgi:hypothetical protein
MNATISGSMIAIQGDLWLRFQNDFGFNQGNIAFFPYGTLRRDTSMPVGRPVVRPEDPTRRRLVALMAAINPPSVVLERATHLYGRWARPRRGGVVLVIIVPPRP